MVPDFNVSHGIIYYISVCSRSRRFDFAPIFLRFQKEGGVIMTEDHRPTKATLQAHVSNKTLRGRCGGATKERRSIEGYHGY